MEVDPLIERIRKAAKEQGVTQAQLREIADLPSQSAISNIFTGKRRLQRHEEDKLLDFLGLEREAEVHFVPLIGLASAGGWNEAILMPISDLPIPRGIAGKRAFAVEIKGDSMDKLLPEGGWAVVDPDQRNLYANRVYLIQNDDHEATVKRYCGDPARFEPVSNNPMHEPMNLADVPYTVIGRVVSYGNTSGL